MGHCTVKEHYLWSSLSDQADVRLRGACLTMVPQILLDGSDVYELYVKRTVKPQKSIAFWQFTSANGKPYETNFNPRGRS